MCAVVNGYNIDGIQYKGPNGDSAWQIQVSLESNRTSSYWVSQGKFFSVQISRFHNMTHENQIEVFGEIEAIPEGEKAAILKAISEWEKPVEARAPQAG